jgi:hypothetical protein
MKGTAMSDIKISELPDAVELSGAELIPLVQDGETRKTTADQLPSVSGNKIKISDLPDADPLMGNEVIPLVQNDGNGGLATRKTPLSALGNALGVPDYSRITKIFLSQIGGDDSTAQIGRIDKPFQTFNAAYDAAVEHPQNAYCDLPNGKFVYDSINKKYYRYTDDKFVSGDTPQKLKNLTSIPWAEGVIPQERSCHITSDGHLWMLYHSGDDHYDYITIIRLSDMATVCNWQTLAWMGLCQPLGFHAATKTLYYFNDFSHCVEKAVWDGSSTTGVTSAPITITQMTQVNWVNAYDYEEATDTLVTWSSSVGLCNIKTGQSFTPADFFLHTNYGQIAIVNGTTYVLNGYPAALQRIDWSNQTLVNVDVTNDSLIISPPSIASVNGRLLLASADSYYVAGNPTHGLFEVNTEYGNLTLLNNQITVISNDNVANGFCFAGEGALFKVFGDGQFYQSTPIVFEFTSGDYTLTGRAWYPRLYMRGAGASNTNITLSLSAGATIYGEKSHTLNIPYHSALTESNLLIYNSWLGQVNCKATAYDCTFANNSEDGSGYCRIIGGLQVSASTIKGVGMVDRLTMTYGTLKVVSATEIRSFSGKNLIVDNGGTAVFNSMIERLSLSAASQTNTVKNSTIQNLTVHSQAKGQFHGCVINALTFNGGGSGAHVFVLCSFPQAVLTLLQGRNDVTLTGCCGY